MCRLVNYPALQRTLHAAASSGRATNCSVSPIALLPSAAVSKYAPSPMKCISVTGVSCPGNCLAGGEGSEGVVSKSTVQGEIQSEAKRPHKSERRAGARIWAYHKFLVRSGVPHADLGRRGSEPCAVRTDTQARCTRLAHIQLPYNVTRLYTLAQEPRLTLECPRNT